MHIPAPEGTMARVCHGHSHLDVIATSCACISDYTALNACFLIRGEEFSSETTRPTSPTLMMVLRMMSSGETTDANSELKETQKHGLKCAPALGQA